MIRHISTSATLAILAVLALAAPVCAREQGDFTPRGALMHARLTNLQSNLKKLGGGDDYLAPLERLWTFAPRRDAEEMQALLDEIRLFIKSAQSVEFALGDIMVREPYTQTISIIELAEGAPEQFSEVVRNWAKKEFRRKAVVEPKAMDIEAFHFRLYPGMLVITTGEGMLKHVEDVMAGNLEESLSQVKRFKDWREKAKGDVVAFADMKAWRNCIDRLGREVDRELLDVLTVLEWQKWDVLSLELDIPGASDGGLAVRADLSLTEAFGPLSAMIRGPGGFTLFDILPAETLGLIAAQLGSDHERTYNELLVFFHETEWRMRHGSLERRIESYKRYLAEAQASYKAAENDDEKKLWQDQIEQYQSQIQEFEAELASGKPRAFEADREKRKEGASGRSDAEEFHDELNGFLKEAGLTREQLFEILGNQVGAGVVGLPDPQPDDDDINIFGEMWFIAARSTGDVKSIKDKFLAAINKDRSPNPDHSERPAIVGKPVEGGELIPLGDGPLIFIGDSIVGLAANSDVAKRILSASAGKDRMSMAKIPGGLPSGSKLVYADVGELVARMLDGYKVRRLRQGEAPAKSWDVRAMLRGGFRVCAFDMEYPTRVSLNIATGGETNLRSLLNAFADDVGSDRAWRHDNRELEVLGDACDAWFSANRDELAKLKDGERTDMIKAVTIATLIKGGKFIPLDGLRSAFDPAMEARFKEMVARRDDKLGVKEGPVSDVSESGFDWFGLPLDEIVVRGEDRDFGYDNLTDAWLVAATKGSWAHGGRVCLLQSGLNFRVVWLSEDDYNSLKLSNSSGGRLKTFKPKGEQPLWKLKLKLKRMHWQLSNCSEMIRDNLKQADGTYKEFKFDGSEHKDAFAVLREKLNAGEQFWLEGEFVKRVIIQSNEKGYTIRVEMGGQWIEIDQNNKVTNSWGDE